jgi:hypothetical protein
MKIVRISRKQAGNTLLLALFITALIGAALISYLTLVKSQEMAGMRSQAWNATIPVIEAGMEEALTHLNTHGASNLVSDGWTYIPAATPQECKYVMERQIGEHLFNVCIYNIVPGASNQFPVIESRGFVASPLLLGSANGPAMFASYGGQSTTTNRLARGVRADARQDFIFTKAMVAKCDIDLGGNNIKSDSFDSADPLYSTGGKYDPAKTRDNGDIATDCAIINSINVGNADIYGHLSTGPGGSVAIGPQGCVGSTAFHNTYARGVESGYVKDDMNVDFPDSPTPPSTGFPVVPIVGGTNGYDYVLLSGNYTTASLDLNNQSMLIQGNVNLYVTGDFSISGLSGGITLASGATLKLWVGGSGSIAGNGIVNPGSALNLMYYGMPSSMSLAYAGNGTFVGTIYAPNAAFTLSGSGNNVYDFVGASITKTVTMRGHFNFHYDEALRNSGPFRGFILTSWNEMVPTEVLANIPPY